MNLHNDSDDIEYRTAMELQMRKISDEQIHKFEGYAESKWKGATQGKTTLYWIYKLLDRASGWILFAER
jgi:hypothetical protein